jgi:hypothetical protein
LLKNEQRAAQRIVPTSFKVPLVKIKYGLSVEGRQSSQGMHPDSRMSAGSYAAFSLDPDDNNVEAVLRQNEVYEASFGRHGRVGNVFHAAEKRPSLMPSRSVELRR